MTLAGWQLWPLDALYLRRLDAQATVDAYVRDNSALLAPGQAGTNDLSRLGTLVRGRGSRIGALTTPLKTTAGPAWSGSGRPPASLHAPG